MSAKERIILLLLAALNFTHIMDFMIMMPLGNFLMPYFNITSQAFSMLVAAYTFSAGLSGFTAAFFVDRFDRKSVLLFGFAGFLIGTICCAIAPSYAMLLGARIVAGLFGGLISAQVLSIVSDLIPYDRRASAMGMIMAAFSVASVFGVPFGLYLANHFSWHAPFYFAAGLGVLLLPLILRYIPAMNKHVHTAKEKRVDPITLVKDIAHNRSQVLALGLSATLMMGHFMIIPFLNPFMEFNKGFSKTQTPMIYFVGGLLTLFTSPLFGRVADKVGKYRLFSILATIALVPVAIITNLPDIPFAVVLCVTGFWFVVSSGRAIPAQAMVSHVVPADRRGSFMSFNSSVQQIFVGLASVVAGFIVVKQPDNTILHYNVTGYFSIAIAICCIYIASLLNKRMQANERIHTEPLAGNINEDIKKAS
ncbi:MFS transporter [Polluticoccus soli]|uniref:MFS transporter n=1 Tax=Polluticoccus soli TaxID=3034150 RepID=UPI0023E2066C|nr:MFS transporter [Flavipsychrobacter sp. JY13-12]